MVANIMCLWPLIRKVTGWSTFLRQSSGSHSRSLTGSSPGALMPESVGMVGTVFRLKPMSNHDEESVEDKNSEEDAEEDGKEFGRVQFYAI